MFCPFSQQIFTVLSAYYIPGSVLGTEDTTVRRIKSCSMEKSKKLTKRIRMVYQMRTLNQGREDVGWGLVCCSRDGQVRMEEREGV